MRDRIPEEEIEKWLSRLKKEMKNTKATNKKGKEFLNNINAYIHDCEYFQKKEDLVVAWELISFAWGLFEAGLFTEIIESVKGSKKYMFSSR